jgi:hypothetical protein
MTAAQPKPTINSLLDPAEIAAARKAQQSMIRAALGAQYPIWAKSAQNRKKLGDP